MIEIRIGYVPLTDAAVVLAASDRGIAARHGLRLVLEREPSWATLRDKLVLGLVDAAHILAPLAIATTLGLSPGGAVPLVSPFGLNRNGNAITVSTALWSAITEAGPTGNPAEVAASLGAVIRSRADRTPLTFATVFPFSCHTYQLRAFLRAGGIDPDRDVRITVVPPPYAVQALRAGTVDGFCVGSPWNSLAVEAGIGRIAALACQVWPDAPEKLFAWPRGRLAPEVADRLVAALAESAAWCAEAANRAELADLLGRPEHLDLDPAIIRRTLDGRLAVDRDGMIVEEPAYLRLGGAAHRPDPSDAEAVLARMVEAGQLDRIDADRLAYIAPLFDRVAFDRANVMANA